MLLPAAVSAAMVVSELVGFFAAMPPLGVPLGFAIAAARRVAHALHEGATLGGTVE